MSLWTGKYACECAYVTHLNRVMLIMYAYVTHSNINVLRLRTTLRICNVGNLVRNFV